MPSRCLRCLTATAFTLLAVALVAGPLPAQAADRRPAAAASALAACRTAASKKDKAGARASADTAAGLYEALMKARPRDPDPLVGRARVINECEMPFANFLRLPGLAGDATAILRRALALDSTHWGARYSLALNHYHAPEFLGHTDDAIREFERLLREQGVAATFPEMARPYAYLGDLYARENRAADAEQVWRRGAALFPADQPLRKRLDQLAQKKPETEP